MYGTLYRSVHVDMELISLMLPLTVVSSFALDLSSPKYLPNTAINLHGMFRSMPFDNNILSSRPLLSVPEEASVKGTTCDKCNNCQ